ncbi:DNA-binding response regulator [Streptomyces sp. NBRC 14336]|uniref:response regulator transcription factor n=1 Tax=Streptomyces sp. NBRC 14336 TaxID=3030992 RepID=UPI0024A4FEF3|nr:response regulator transcription factor [Streptomyces sp. NBRC 14336]GLW49171.1 DNA-binding response regulator [Streptomyces sp. NBRC 14336]
MGILGCRTLERAGVRHVLEADDRITVVGEDTVGQAPGLVRSTRPDVLVASHQDPEEALAALRAHRAAEPARVVLVGRLTDQATRMLLRFGARGVLLREDGARHLPWAVHATAAGSVALAPTTAGFVVDQYVRPGRVAEEAAAARKLLASLSPRERQVLELVSNGASNPVVAETLRISRHTVKDHIRAIYNKLLVGNRVQAARILWQADSAPGRTAQHTTAPAGRGGPAGAG